MCSDERHLLNKEGKNAAAHQPFGMHRSKASMQAEHAVEGKKYFFVHLIVWCQTRFVMRGHGKLRSKRMLFYDLLSTEGRALPTVTSKSCIVARARRASRFQRNPVASCQMLRGELGVAAASTA